MDRPTCVLDALARTPSERDLDDLAALLGDAVDSGAAVSFLAPLPRDAARAFWRRTAAEMGARSVVLVARDGLGIAGTVTLHAAWAPNQPHRGEIAKLIVHRRARRQGLGDRLMERAEQHARDVGLSLLTLDAKRGAAAELLYQRRGWTRVGAIPDFAVDPDGAALHDTVIYFKRVGAGPELPLHRT